MEPAFRSSVSGRFADFVVNLGEGVLTAQFLPQFVIQLPVKHLPKLLSLHVHVGIEHLEAAWGHRVQFTRSVDTHSKHCLKH